MEPANGRPTIGEVLRLLTEPGGVLKQLGKIGERVKALVEWTDKHEKRHAELEECVTSLEDRITDVDLQHAEEDGAKRLLLSVLPFAVKIGVALAALLLAALGIKGIGGWSW